MIAFAIGLVGPAELAGIKVPVDPENFDPDCFPHFSVFLSCQLGKPMPSPGCHWENAKIIAAISEEDIRAVTDKKLLELGWSG